MVNPSKWVNLKSNFLKFHHRNQAISGIEKARKMAYFRAFLALLSCRLSLAELRSATSCFEAVLREFLSCFPFVSQTERIGDICALFAEKNIGGVPVTKDGEIIGIITEKDILNAIKTL